ncbi:hypothetical protein ACLKA6_008088 [Drosophila palustris]
MKRPLLLLLLLSSTPPPAATTAVTRGSDRGNQPMRSGRRLRARHQIPPSRAVLDSGRAQTADSGQRPLIVFCFLRSILSDNHHHHWRQAFPEHYRNQKSRVNQSPIIISLKQPQRGAIELPKRQETGDNEMRLQFYQIKDPQQQYH